MPEIRVEDLPEERRVELAVAAVESERVHVVQSGGGWRCWALDNEAYELLDKVGMTHEVTFPRRLDAYAAGALVLGLEPRWRVVDKAVADEWIASESEMTKEMPPRSMTPDVLAGILNRHSKARAAIARALAGEA